MAELLKKTQGLGRSQKRIFYCLAMVIAVVLLLWTMLQVAMPAYAQVYKLWQQHDATGQPDWSPDKAVSLWDICHTTDPKLAKPYTAPQGSRGLWQAGECCTLEGRVWRCKADNNAYGPLELAERWEDLGAVEDPQCLRKRSR